MSIPATVTNVVVLNPLTATSLVVTWNPISGPATAYNVYRSYAKQGPFTLLSTSPVNGTSYTDVTAQQRSHTLYWYTVTALDGVNEGFQSEAASNTLIARDDSNATLPRMGDEPEQNQKAILSEIVRRDGLLLRRGGEYVNVYVRITAGPKCTSPGCFQPSYNQPGNPNCTICYGTTYVGGYDKYPGILCKIKPITTKLTLMEMGLRIDSSPPAWIGTYPIVNNGDILVRQFNNKRYEIQSVNQTISRGILVRQDFTLNELLPSLVPVIYQLN